MPLVVRPVALALLFLAHASLLAYDPPFRYGPWRHSIIGGGGYIQNVVLCPSDPKRAYSYVDNSGIFRSDDGGRTWRIIHGSMPVSFGIYDIRGLAVDPRDADRIIAAIGTQWDKPWGIFVSDDGGTSWKQTLTAAFFGGDEHRFSGFILQRHPARPDELTAASGIDGVFRSTDNGQTWKKLGLENVFATDLKYDRTNPDRLWLSAIKTQLRARHKDPIPGGFYRSEDNGATWQKLSEESPSEIIQDPKDGARLYGIFDYTHIRLSTDAGKTWSDFSDGLELVKPGERPSGNHPRAYYALAAGPDFVLTASGMGTFYRLDCGQSAWKRLERGAVKEHYAGRPWFASEERGSHGHFGAALGSITIDPANPRRWFFTDFYAIYQTLDAGRNWFLSCDGVDATVLFCLTQNPAEPATVHMGMADNGFFLSEDGGDRFSPVGGGVQNCKCLSVCRAQPARIYAVGSGLTPQTNGMRSAQLWVSIDRGRTWVPSAMKGLPSLSANGAQTIEADPRDPHVAYLAVSSAIKKDGGGVYRTSDGGQSWEWIGQRLPEGNWFFRPTPWNIGRELAVGIDGTLVAFGAAGTWCRPAGADAWVPASKGLPHAPNEVVADPHHPGHFYASLEGSGGVFRSENNGATWTPLYRGNSRHVAVDLAKPGRIVAGLVDGVVLSVDGGKTWTPLDARLPYRFQPLVAFAGERVLAGTVGNGCFWIPISPEGEASVQAKEAPPAYRGEAAMAKPFVPAGALTDHENAASKWSAAPGLRVSRDTKEFKQGPASLCVESAEGGEGTITHMIDLPAGATDQPLFAGGWIKTEGNLEMASLSIYSIGKTGTWHGLVNAPSTQDWMEFSRGLILPPDATKLRLQFTVKGKGKAWLDEFNLSGAEVWKQAP